MLPVASQFRKRRGESALEGKHWFALGTALQVTKYALLLSWISLGLLGLSIVGTALAGRTTQPDAVLQGAISLLIMWGSVGIFVGWTVLAVGWLMCLTVWSGLERRWLRISIGTAVFIVVAILTLLSVQSLWARSNLQEEARAIALTTKIIFFSFGVAAAMALTAFGYFLAALEVRLGNDRNPREASCGPS